MDVVSILNLMLSPPRSKSAETRRRRREERLSQAWTDHLTFLMNPHPRDGTRWLLDVDVSDGDIEGALRFAIAQVRQEMYPPTPEQLASEPTYDVYDDRPLMYDVAVVHGGQILAVIQATARGPVVTRLRPMETARPGGPR
jgi:hypothetical protein